MLLVHIPVVLVPLGALGAVLMLWPRLRQMIGWWVCGLLVIAGIATQLAISSGQSLEEYVRESALVRDHTRIGENIRPWLLLLFLALVGVMIIDRALKARARDASPQADPLRFVALTLSAMSIVFAGFSVYWTYRIGHSGSKAVWHSTQTRIDKGVRRREGGESDDR